MSAAASAAPRRGPTQGYAQIPNSLIENQAAFTHAELALTLIVLRRGGVGENAVTVSDRNWQGWTGLSPRLKEYAVVGLKKKCLGVAGRGQGSRFSFQSDIWEQFVRSNDRAKPRTAGRKSAVTARPGSKVHPDCWSRGCALLAQEAANGGSDQTGAGGLKLVPATPIAQPVAQTMVASGGCSAAAAPGSKQTKPVLATPIAQPVARLADIWVKTLAVLQACFPMVGTAFLARLLAVVQAMFAGVTDSELADAVALAWDRKRTRQLSEGLFLVTVPDALGLLRRRPAPVSRSAPSAGSGGPLARLAAALEARGQPFANHAALARSLAVMATGPTGDLGAIESECERLEAQIVETAAGRLSGPERAAVDAAVSQAVAPYRERLPAPQLTRLTDQFRSAEILRLVGVPPLSSFY